MVPRDFNERLIIEIVRRLAELTGAPLYCVKDNRQINCNSVLGFLSLNLKQGDIVKFETQDPKKLKLIESILFFNF